MALAALVLAACSQAAPPFTFNSTGGWVGTACGSDCVVFGFAVSDSGGARATLSGTTLAYVNGAVQTMGSLRGSRTNYGANWRTDGSGGYLIVNGTFNSSSNTFSGSMSLTSYSSGTASASVSLEKTDDGMGSLAVRPQGISSGDFGRLVASILQ